MIGIYKISSPSGKVYIGQSWNINRRHYQYSKLLNCKEQSKLYNSFLKYGVENHIFEICHELPIDIEQEILDRYEQFYMDQYRSCGIELMNLKEGGNNGKLSEETKQKLRISNGGINHPLFGKKQSVETIYKRVQKLKGKKRSEQSKINIKNSLIGRQSSMFGKRHSDFTKRIMSEKRKGQRNAIKQVYQYSKENVFIKSWESGADASIKLKISSGNISSCLNNKLKTAGGFIWKFSLN